MGGGLVGRLVGWGGFCFETGIYSISQFVSNSLCAHEYVMRLSKTIVSVFMECLSSLENLKNGHVGKPLRKGVSMASKNKNGSS